MNLVDQSRQQQKRRNRQQYVERYRQYEKAAVQARQQTEKVRRKLARFARKHSKAGLAIVAIAIFLVAILGGLSSCAMMVGSGISRYRWYSILSSCKSR